MVCARLPILDGKTASGRGDAQRPGNFGGAVAPIVRGSGTTAEQVGDKGVARQPMLKAMIVEDNLAGECTAQEKYFMRELNKPPV